MDTTLAVLILTVVRLVIPVTLMLMVGTWLHKHEIGQAF